MHAAADPVDARIHLTTDGVSLLLDVTAGRLPAVLHWGAALGDLDADDAAAIAIAAVPPLAGNVVDRPVRIALLPEHWTGWVGTPGIAGSRSGRDWSPRCTVVRATLNGRPLPRGLVTAGTASLHVEAVDEDCALRVALDVELLPGGLVRLRAAITNASAEPYDLEAVTVALPVPPRAREVLDLAGRWGKERVPQRGPLQVGTHLRENRKGRTGLDAATVLTVGEPGFGFAAGEVWGLHVGFSGNHRHLAERTFTGEQLVAGGELLLPGEVRLGAGETYTAPWVYGAYGRGLDDQAARFHTWLRSRPGHPASPRPVTLNVWEAVEMDHDLPALLALADRAAAAGVERFVLDDGWMLGRRDDTGGLGDWVVDPAVWPHGLHPLVDHVRALGMEFGLWFEPEMVSPGSQVATAHPDWILAVPGRLPVPSRYQQVLDLTNPAAYDHVLGQVSAVIAEYAITAVKWDHNRDLIDAGSPAAGGAAAVHRQTLAVYRLLAALHDRFPDLEIESCSSGGGRVDLGILQHTQRVWGSDCIDPLERQQINRWTMQLIPPELLGSHVGRTPNHSTDRVQRLSFRAGSSLIGHFGVEWDLTAATPGELEDLAGWIALHRRLRPLLHTGRLVRTDAPDEHLQITGVVAADRRQAVFVLGYLDRAAVSPRGRITLPGLDPGTRYRVRPVFVGTPSRGIQAPQWFGTQVGDGYPQPPARGQQLPGVVLSGRVLTTAGLQAPASMPEEAIVLLVTAEDGSGAGTAR